MGGISSRLVRQVQRFNVENRAMRAIERKTPVVAPRHSTAAKYLDRIIDETPEVRVMLENKDEKLDKYLKDVYVTSTGVTPEIVRDKSLLPQRRAPVTEDEFGFWQPAEVPEGKASLPQILKFLTQHQMSGQSYSAEIIAKEYKIDEKTVANVLEFYQPLNAYVPENENDQRGMFALSRLKDIKRNLLSEPDDKNKT